MLRPDLVDELVLIAFNGYASPSNRIMAISTLYKIGYDNSRLMKALEDIATGQTADSVKVKALDLLHRIDEQVGNAPLQQSIDEQNITQQLMETYCG